MTEEIGNCISCIYELNGCCYSNVDIWHMVREQKGKRISNAFLCSRYIRAQEGEKEEMQKKVKWQRIDDAAREKEELIQ